MIDLILLGYDLTSHLGMNHFGEIPPLFLVVIDLIRLGLGHLTSHLRMNPDNDTLPPPLFLHSLRHF